MIFWLILVVIVIAIVLIAGVLFGKPKRHAYEYKKQDCIMTQSEKKCFDALVQAVGNRYEIFPQIHLPSFLNHKIQGQNWMGAFRHIDEKSVDFVLCDKGNLSPLLAIELDDRSHNRPDRQERDREVERILREAHMPLIRLRDHEAIDINTIAQRIDSSIDFQEITKKHS